jgi:hypothetical protein
MVQIRRTSSPRVADRLRPGGRLVLGDVVVPDDLVDVVTPIDGVYDPAEHLGDQVRWLAAVGLDTELPGAPRHCRDRRRFTFLMPTPLETIDELLDALDGVIGRALNADSCCRNNRLIRKGPTP